MPHVYDSGREQNLPALDPVSHHAANQRKHENRDAAEELVEPEQERGMTQTIDEPALRYDLHPGANARGAGTDPHQPEVTIMKRLKDLAELSLHTLRACFVEFLCPKAFRKGTGSNPW